VIVVVLTGWFCLISSMSWPGRQDDAMQKIDRIEINRYQIILCIFAFRKFTAKLIIILCETICACNFGIKLWQFIV